MATLRSGWIGTGPRTARFEERFAELKGSPHAVAVSSGTAALHLSCLVAGLGRGDEVIVPAMTFCATANAVLHAGALPVLADCEAASGNVDPEAVERAITPRTRAILPVHLAGRPCEMDAILDLARRHGLKVIEDAAHAIETEYRGRPAGTLGDLGCFSFYVTKNLITGEGGMVVTDDGEAAARIKIMALHGLSADAWQRYSDEGYKHYLVTECGFKSNLTDLQAALGLHQLERLEQSWERRRAIWEHYQQALADLPLGRPPAPAADTRHAFHLYPVLVDPDAAGLTRDRFIEAMTERKIGVGVHFMALPEHPYYRQHLGWKPEDTPTATRIGRQTVSLPLSPGLSDEDVEDVIEAVRDVVHGEGR